jgi:uncharacterized RDD family membrane protein YckC
VLGRPLASWGQRLGAILLDALILLIPLVLLGLLLLHTTHTVRNSQGLLVQRRSIGGSIGWSAASSALWCAYYTVCLIAGQGRTLGMRALHIGVRRAADGGALSPGQALGRSACFFVLVVPFIGGLVGILDVLFPLWDGRRQALHDKIAGTVVVRDYP